MNRSKLRFKHGIHIAAALLLGSMLLHVPMANAKFLAVTVSSEDNFRNLLSSSIEKAVDDRRDDVYIDSAENNFAVQVQQIESYIKAGADAIIIFPCGTPEQNESLFKYAEKVPLVFINTEPTDDLEGMPRNTIYVGSNELESGTMQMEELARLAGYKGKIALMMGDMNHKAARTRTQDVDDVVAKYPNLTVIKRESGFWQRNKGYKIVSDWIKQGVDFDILLGNNDEMIIGGIMALRDAGKDPKKYLTGGVDATKDALIDMSKGDLDVTVLQDAVGQGRAAVEMAYKMINGERVKSPHWVPFKLVTKDNYQQFVKD
ncbi:substrate-binding domain-containing protein [Vibrio eleionomae]|nr:substrate-binding domain-containing protein [Vibrio eleionomae]